MGLMESLRAKLELYRLEQKYARRDKRTTLYAAAQYVDGEYVYGSDRQSARTTTTTTTTTGKGSGGMSKFSSVVKVTEVLGKRASRAW